MKNKDFQAVVYDDFAGCPIVVAFLGNRWWVVTPGEKVQPLALVPFAIIVGFMVAGVSEWVFQFSNPTTLALMLSIFPLMQNNKSR